MTKLEKHKVVMEAVCVLLREREVEGRPVTAKVMTGDTSLGVVISTYPRGRRTFRLEGTHFCICKTSSLPSTTVSVNHPKVIDFLIEATAYCTLPIEQKPCLECPFYKKGKIS